MKIKAAIEQMTWISGEAVPTSVLVQFRNNEGMLDETELDLHSVDKESELEELWETLFAELGAEEDSVISVEDLGYLN